MRDPQLVVELLGKAGNIALAHFRNVEPSIKDNKSYVTQADLEIQEFLRDEILARFPDDGVVGEEEGLRKEPSRGGMCWVVDPIDGTASFVNGLPIWGIAVGVFEDARPHSGFFYMPVTGDLYACSPGQPVTRNGHPTQMRPTGPLHRESVLLAVSRVHRQFEIDWSYPGKVRSLGSTIAHIAYVATGSADAALMGRARIWDVAAGLAMLAANGGEVQYLSGQEPVDFAGMLMGGAPKEPILAGAPSTIAQYREVVTQKPRNRGGRQRRRR